MNKLKIGIGVCSGILGIALINNVQGDVVHADAINWDNQNAESSNVVTDNVTSQLTNDVKVSNVQIVKQNYVSASRVSPQVSNVQAGQVNKTKIAQFNSNSKIYGLDNSNTLSKNNGDGYVITNAGTYNGRPVDIAITINNVSEQQGSYTTKWSNGDHADVTGKTDASFKYDNSALPSTQQNAVTVPNKTRNKTENKATERSFSGYWYIYERLVGGGSHDDHYGYLIDPKLVADVMTGKHVNEAMALSLITKNVHSLDGQFSRDFESWSKPRKYWPSVDMSTGLMHRGDIRKWHVPVVGPLGITESDDNFSYADPIDVSHGDGSSENGLQGSVYYFLFNNTNKNIKLAAGQMINHSDSAEEGVGNPFRYDSWILTESPNFDVNKMTDGSSRSGINMVHFTGEASLTIPDLKKIAQQDNKKDLYNVLDHFEPQSFKYNTYTKQNVTNTLQLGSKTDAKLNYNYTVGVYDAQTGDLITSLKPEYKNGVKAGKTAGAADTVMNNAIKNKIADIRNNKAVVAFNGTAANDNVAFYQETTSVQDVSKLTATASRTITLHFPNNQKPASYDSLVNSNNQIVQTLKFTRTGTTDLVTGQTTYTNWQGNSKFPDVKLPKLPGFKLQIS